MKHRFLVIVVAAVGVSSHVLALPPAPVVVGGGAVLSGGTVPLTTTGTASGSISWQSYSIGAGQSVKFAQPSGSTSVLNSALGSAPAISGHLVSGGQVVVTTPSGIVGNTRVPSGASALVPASARLADGAVTIRMPLVDAAPISIR